MPGSAPRRTRRPRRWAADVITQVRATQFDDGTTAALSGTSVCVQLFKAPSTVSKLCSIGGTAARRSPCRRSLTVAPAVPASLATGACVVRVLAARKFTINGVVTKLEWHPDPVRDRDVRTDLSVTAR